MAFVNDNPDFKKPNNYVNYFNIILGTFHLKLRNLLGAIDKYELIEKKQESPEFDYFSATIGTKRSNRI